MQATVIAPLAEAQQTRRADIAAKAAATKVQFFAMRNMRVMSAEMLQPGFADPVAGAQACFRAVLDAMARPGRVREAGADLTPPAPLAPATAAVLLTLVDHDTPVWLDQAAAAARAWIAFHCGAPIVAAIAACSFALALSCRSLRRCRPARTRRRKARRR